MNAFNATTLFVALGVTLGCLANSGCAHQACKPQILAGIEAKYSAAVLLECQGHTLADCPAAPLLKAERKQAEEGARCR